LDNLRIVHKCACLEEGGDVEIEIQESRIIDLVKVVYWLCRRQARAFLR